MIMESKITFYVWIAIGVVCLIGAVTGHPHHIGTFALCSVMAAICKRQNTKK